MAIVMVMVMVMTTRDQFVDELFLFSYIVESDQNRAKQCVECMQCSVQCAVCSTIVQYSCSVIDIIAIIIIIACSGRASRSLPCMHDSGASGRESR